MSLATQQSLESHYVMHTFGRSPVEFVEGHGMKLTGDDGREYLDFLAGIGVCSLGHGNPAVLSALEAQTKKLMHVSNYFYIEQRGQVAALLSKLANDDVDGACVLADAIAAGDETTAAALGAPAADEQVWETFFANSGAEANEGSMKLARLYAKRAGNGGNTIVCMRGGFHGRTFMTMALTGKVAPYKIGFGPFPGSVYHVPYPSDLHGISTQDSLDAIERLFKSDIEAKQVVAIIFEPVQGEGGFNVAPKELVAAIRRLCDEHGIVMIADEVQSGFARTGKLFAMDHYADKPDLMTMAKSLAGGMPLSGVVGNANIMDAPAPGGLGGTYAGNPLAVAAAHAVLNIIDKESLCERANQLGQRLKNTLIDAKESVPAIAAVRGLGSMIAAEFTDPKTGEPSAAIAQKIQQRALAQGLLLLTCGAYGNVIRFLYPLTIPDAQFDAAMKILQDALSD